MKTFNRIPLTLAGGALLAGCLFQQEGDSESAMAKARLDIRASVTESAALAKTAADSAAGLTMVDAAGLTFHVTEARAFVDKIKLIGLRDSCGSDDGKDSIPLSKLGHDSSGHGDDDPIGHGRHHDDSTGCDDHDRNAKVGPFVIDLVTGATTPAMDEFVVDAGSYRKVKFHLDHAQVSDSVLPAGDALLGHTLLVKGDYRLPGDTAGTPFTLALKFNEEVEMQALSDMVLDPNTLSTILVRLRMDGWLNSLGVATCLADAEVKASLAGGVTITEDSVLGKCLDVEKTVKRNIRASFRVGKDKRGKGGI